MLDSGASGVGEGAGDDDLLGEEDALGDEEGVDGRGLVQLGVGVDVACRTIRDNEPVKFAVKPALSFT